MKNFYRDGGLIISVCTLILISAVLAASVYIHYTVFFWITLPFLVLVVGFTLGKLFVVTNKTYQYFAYIADRSEFVRGVSLSRLPISVCIADSSHRIVWFNDEFASEFKSAAVYGNSFELITNIDINYLLKQNAPVGGDSESGAVADGDRTNFTARIEHEGRYYITGALIPPEADASDIFIVYFRNITEETMLEKKYRLSRHIVILILIDSYDETVERNSDSEKARVIVEIDRVVGDFFKSMNGIVRKVGDDKYMVAVESRYVDEILSDKVKLLDKGRSINVSERMFASFSIGIGDTGTTLKESEDFAKQALDMAQGRGGDQAAVKTDKGFEFYGGVSKGVERQTKVKSRIIANSVTDLAMRCGNVYIMGHRGSDMDSVGAAVGMCAALRRLFLLLCGAGNTKRAFVVFDRNTSLSVPLADRVIKSGEDMFITPSKAVDNFDEEDLLIIVDTHNKNLLDDRDLYNTAKNVVVIDHHRKMVDYIDNTLIFHHEPYASSASEMVTELVQSFEMMYPGSKLAAVHADALLAGIMLDTKSFTVKAGVHTFEAAAYLRKLGAEPQNVKALFSNTFDSFRSTMQIAASAKIYRRCAIASAEQSVSNSGGDMRIIAPQAADELLKIKDVDASFVLFRTNRGKEPEVSISARSLGIVNVQLVMEVLGGGGHQNMAGVQIKNMSVTDAEELLIRAIDTIL